MENLVHYTKSIESLNGILENGLLLNPIPRKLIHEFGTLSIFKIREPQQFGMCSFRKDGLIGSKRHIETFGEFGLVLKKDFLNKHQIQQVRYFKAGTKYAKYLSTLYQQGLYELDNSSFSTSFGEHKYINKTASYLLSASSYVEFLNHYEFLEPFENRWQREWRIVQKSPLYLNNTISELVSGLYEPNWLSIVATIQFNKGDISHFVTTKPNISKIKKLINKSFKSVPIFWKIYI